MLLKITPHGQARLLEREIHYDHIKHVMLHPEATEDVGEGKKRVKGTVGKKVLFVVYKKEEFRDKKDTYLVITSYWKEI